MGRLTKAQVSSLGRSIDKLERIHKFIQSDGIAVCVVRQRATNNLDYVRQGAFNEHMDRSPADALPLSRIAKDIGSELAMLPDAIRDLKRLVSE